MVCNVHIWSRNRNGGLEVYRRFDFEKFYLVAGSEIWYTGFVDSIFNAMVMYSDYSFSPPGKDMNFILGKLTFYVKNPCQ